MIKIFELARSLPDRGLAVRFSPRGLGITGISDVNHLKQIYMNRSDNTSLQSYCFDGGSVVELRGGAGMPTIDKHFLRMPS